MGYACSMRKMGYGFHMSGTYQNLCATYIGLIGKHVFVEA